MAYSDILIVFLKKIFLVLLGYFIGYLQFSIIWVILPILLDLAKEHHLKERFKRRDLHRRIILSDEKEVIGSLPNLPAWVCFPDVERAEWLNKIIRQLWPNVNSYVHDIIKELLEAKLNRKLEKYKLSGLVFEKLIVGIIPFRVGGVIVYENNSRNEIVLDMDILYAGDCDIKLKLSKMTGSITDFQLYGRMRLIIKPLINILPLVGGIQAFFLNPPEIDFDLDGLGGLLEFPGFSDLLKKLILDTICSVIVLPNKYPIRLSKTVSKQDIKIPQPKGVLRIHVVQARKLMKRDLTFTGQLTSDPYAILSIGDQEYKTPMIERTAKPKWDYWCEFIVEEINGVYLFLSVWDHDTMQEDEPLGRAKIELSKLVERQNTGLWFNLENVKHGEVHIRTSWLSLSTDRDDLNQILYEIQHLQVPTLNCAILTVFVVSVTNILSEKNPSKLYSYVEIELADQNKVTKTFRKQTDPVWDEGFIFLVSNIKDCITFKVFNGKEENFVGQLTYDINALLKEEELQIEKHAFKLAQNTTSSELVLSMNLKILQNEAFKNRDPAVSGDISKNSDDDSKNLDLSEHSSYSSSSSISSTDSSKSDIISPAKIKLTLRYSVQRQRLIVVVHHIEGLHFDETKAIYVKLYILPERHKDSKRKTQVIKTGKDPTFDETFDFFIAQEELSNKHLEVSLCEEKVLKNETIQKVVIDLDKMSLVLSNTKFFRLFVKSHHS